MAAAPSRCNYDIAAVKYLVDPNEHPLQLLWESWANDDDDAKYLKAALKRAYDATASVPPDAENRHAAARGLPSGGHPREAS